jgi:hypothetical protein
MTLESGIIPLSDSEAITSDLTETGFLATAIGRQAVSYTHNGPHRSYKLQKLSFDSQDWTAILFFNNGLLEQTSLHLPANATSWGTLNAKEEEKRASTLRTSIELRLNRSLPAEFPWGRLSVYFDPQNLSGSLIFSYARALKTGR